MANKKPLANYSGTIKELQSGDKIAVSDISDVSATSRLLGRKTAGAGAIEELTVDEVLAFLSDNTTNNVSTSKHGLTPKLPNDATKFFDGQGNYDTVKDSDLSLSDITDNNASTTKHGFTPKLPNDNTKFLDGQGAFDTVKDSDLVTSDITTNNASSTKHGFCPKLPNNTTTFLRGDGTFATPAGGGDFVLLSTIDTQAYSFDISGFNFTTYKAIHLYFDFYCPTSSGLYLNPNLFTNGSVNYNSHIYGKRWINNQQGTISGESGLAMSSTNNTYVYHNGIIIFHKKSNGASVIDYECISQSHYDWVRGKAWTNSSYQIDGIYFSFNANTSFRGYLWGLK